MLKTYTFMTIYPVKPLRTYILIHTLVAYMVKTNNENFSSLAAFIWSVADSLRVDFKQSEYGRIILPLTILRRLECRTGTYTRNRKKET